MLKCQSIVVLFLCSMLNVYSPQTSNFLAIFLRILTFINNPYVFVDIYMLIHGIFVLEN